MNSGPLLLTHKKIGGRILSLDRNAPGRVRKVDIGYERKIFQIYDGKIWNG